jgi:molecular chaperone DnaK
MRIKLKYPDVETFIERYSVNISRGGVFIATRTPKPVGTVLRFEFQLASSMTLIRGEGQVVWVKAFDPDNPRRVHGMGVRFTRLDPESRAMVDRALAWRQEHGAGAGAGPDATPRQSLEGQDADGTELPGPAGGDVGDGDEGDEIGGAAPEAVTEGAESSREVIAELPRIPQEEVVRAARHITELTAGQIYYPEDRELQALMEPVRVPLPPTGREAARLLAGLLRPR